MDIYQGSMDYISNMPILKIWAEAKPLLDHSASLRPCDRRLPALACKAVVDNTEGAIAALAALACAQIGFCPNVEKEEEGEV
jgi:hypothetical protein